LWNVWTAWRNQYLDFSGRVVDGPQERASHSEGQGYGMMLAAEIGDDLAFQRMAEWTQNNLAIRSDKLLAWRWLPDRPERVPDRNNASDGDLFHAWALLRGGEIFAEPLYTERAILIARDIARYCLVPRPDDVTRMLLSPAINGFSTRSGHVFNPSYMMPMALRELGEAADETSLIDAADSGIELITELARTGPVPDWLEITPEGIQPATGFSFDSGYEALRVPLFLLWSGETDNQAIMEFVLAQRSAPIGSFATVVSRDGNDVIELSSDSGYNSIRVVSQCQVEQLKFISVPPFDTRQAYYPATLQLFSFLVLLTSMPSCRPI